MTKINDISDFMNKSIEDLERITHVNGIEKQDFQIGESLTPLRLNVDKVFELITRFNMLPEHTVSSVASEKNGQHSPDD